MKAWWDRLSARERWLVGGGGFFLLFLLGYELLWSPLSTAVDRMREKVRTQSDLVLWLQSADRRVSGARAQQIGLNLSASPVLLSIVESSLAHCHLSRYVKSLQQSSPSSVHLFLQDIPFDAFIDCLHQMVRNEGLVWVQLEVNSTSRPGAVDVKVGLSI